jgi:hypothetical protein
MKTAEEIKDMLTQVAAEKIEEVRPESKPDFNDLGQEKNEARIVKKFHAQGGATKHKRASNDAQKTALTGKDKKTRRKAGIKLKKTLRKRGAGKISRIQRKRERAMKKRGTTFKAS